ncbi:MAG: hypothetical protein QME79_05420 [Bacillota bacterium]|nr:hypothetical protein [Bacillota bacterium]
MARWSRGGTRQNDGRGLGNSATSPVGICHSWAADGRMEAMLRVVRRLRLEEGLQLFADRLSVNIEFASERALATLAPGKTHQALLAPMAFIGSEIRAHREEATRFRHSPAFISAGQSTQLIAGAMRETDFSDHPPGRATVPEGQPEAGLLFRVHPRQQSSPAAVHLLPAGYGTRLDAAWFPRTP